jgi:phage tail-like protein
VTSLAPFLPRPVEPPNDARFLGLGAPRRWEALFADGIDAGRSDGNLTLLPQSPGAGLGAADGSLGGLVPPAVFTPADDGRHVLLDRKSKRVLVFEPCRCAFAMVPCLPSTRLAPGGPIAVLAIRNRLYLSDSGASPAVLVYARDGLVLRAEWKLPPGLAANSWQPGLMAWSGGRLHVADAANGAIHVFAPTGIHERMIAGIGALAALAADRGGDLWIVRQGETVAHRIDQDGTILETVARRDDLSSRFGPPVARVLSDGSLLLDACDPAPARFAADGARLPDPPQALLAPAFTRSGTYVSHPLDSRIETCVWHRIELDLVLPPGTAASAACLTADVPLSGNAVMALPASSWTRLPPVTGSHPDVLVTAAPGRYLWLRLDLTGPGDATPRVGRVEIEFPRVGLARMLPAAFREDPVSADLTDRFTAVMDRPLFDVEARIDHNAALYDPEAAPAKPGADMLSFLASWLGLRFEGRWPVERRRRVLRAMGRLLYLRGTVEGLRQALIAYFGWRTDEGGSCTPVPAGCHPRCGLPAAPGAGLPMMVLEHWRLRRWLFLGAGRLGDAAMLWGAGILDKVELDRGARLNASEVNSVHDTLRDPFHVTAWKFSLFLPARYGRQAAERASIARLVDAFRPAHAAPRIVYVAPRMRIGIQAAIGFDTVIARYPQATTALGAMELGRGTITPVPPRDEPRRLGRDAALEATPIRQHPHGEGQP